MPSRRELFKLRAYALSSGNARPETRSCTSLEEKVEHHRLMKRRFPHIIHVTVLAEDLPENDNRVELDPQATDVNGIPAPRVEYKLSENTLRILDHGARTARELLSAAGAAEIHDEKPMPRIHDGGGRQLLRNEWGLRGRHRRSARLRYAALRESGIGAESGAGRGRGTREQIDCMEDRSRDSCCWNAGTRCRQVIA